MSTAKSISAVPGYLNTLVDRVTKDMENRILLAGATAMHAEMVERVFGEGIDSSGNKIGDYSERPAYFPLKKFVRTSAYQKQGKTNKGDFKNGNERSSMYLKRGYAEFREIQNRQSGYKDYQMSGSLKNNLVVGEENGNIVIGFTDENESLKRHGLEEQVGKDVFPPAASDIEILESAINDEIDAIINEL